MNPPIFVVIESPYAAKNGRTVEANLNYARACLLDSIRRGETPMASHLLYTQVLDDDDPGERALGMQLGFNFYEIASKVVFYVDYGESPGMRWARHLCEGRGIPTETRTLLDDIECMATSPYPHKYDPAYATI